MRKEWVHEVDIQWNMLHTFEPGASAGEVFSANQA
jgi:hypothetical protein